ncbi:ribonuclease HII [Rickettsiales bacterium LUAb2]
MPDFSIETKILANYDNPSFIAGIDEVGRGCLAGPVVTCALVIKDSTLPWLTEVNDSKLLTKLKREQLFNKIINNSYYSLGTANVTEIDNLNILGATKLAMQRAYTKLANTCQISAVLIDGRDNITLANNVKSFSIIKGDQKSITIACASIVAKVTRDNLMAELSKQDNNHVYCWHKNAGYGTKHHKDMLLLHGITEHHRKSFAPIKTMV